MISWHRKSSLNKLSDVSIKELWAVVNGANKYTSIFKYRLKAATH